MHKIAPTRIERASWVHWIHSHSSVVIALFPTQPSCGSSFTTITHSFLMTVHWCVLSFPRLIWLCHLLAGTVSVLRLERPWNGFWLHPTMHQSHSDSYRIKWKLLRKVYQAHHVSSLPPLHHHSKCCSSCSTNFTYTKWCPFQERQTCHQKDRLEQSGYLRRLGPKCLLL